MGGYEAREQHYTTESGHTLDRAAEPSIVDIWTLAKTRANLAIAAATSTGRSLMQVATALSAALLLLACQPEPDTPERVAARIQAQSDSARNVFERIFSSYSRNFNAGRVDSLAAQYASKAHVMPPNHAP